MQRILGQDHALDILRRAIASGRVHHAWVFSGSRGVGKFTTAVEMARILLDPDAGPTLAGDIEADPDGRTSRLIDAGTHPDLHVIVKELALHSENAQLRSRKLANIPIDVLREWMIGGKTGDDRYHDGPVYRTAALGHGKVFIVDEAELIDPVGQNALLKTLEEPPARTYLILVTAHPERLLPTIRSRCQHVRFGPLDAAAMAAWFERSDVDPGPDERAWIESFAAGSPGRALVAARFGLFGWHRTLAPMLDELARGRFPAEMGETMAALIDDYAQAWVKEQKNASKDAANKDGVRHMLSLLAAHARDGLRKSCDEATDPAPWLGAIDVIRAAEQQIASNVFLKPVLENIAAQWARLGGAVAS